ncbi:Receptor-like protein 7 [Citrus sinensis]|nr:Receptor-like protein 7 [Citrus sinensis]
MSSSLSWLANLNQLTSLKFPYCDLNNEILFAISNLTQLNALDLCYNQLTGPIPFGISNLTQLTALYLKNNQLTGPIPYSLMKLKKLSFLFLGFNHLSGRIPVEISNLTQLQHLQLSSNQLEGSVPSSIFELRNLEGLDLSFNNLSGTVDLNMFLLSFKRLRILNLSSNKMSLLTRTTSSTNMQKFEIIGLRSCNLSEFPSFLHNQDKLTSLDLSSNKIDGKIPEWLFSAGTNTLAYLNLSYNLLMDFEHNLRVLPWNNLGALDLRFNKLQGPLPIPSASIFSYLNSNNQLTGEIPPSICSLNGLHALDLSHNNLSGKLPECLGNFSVALSVLKLQSNNFQGSIPQTFMKGTNLAMIDLSNNSLRGRIPKSLANCVKLKFVHLGNNQITDVFPSWLGTLPELEVLVLKSNNFHGEIKAPRTAFDFSKLRIIDLSHNRFGGILPSKHFDCWNSMKYVNASYPTYMHDTLTPSIYPASTYFGFFDYSLTMSNKGTELEYEKLSNLITAIILSNNSFVGEIPTSIANLKGLRNLNLSNNNLQGRIPSSLSNLTAIESMDLSSNMLSGNIPQQLSELTFLAVFNVSDNLLTGPIPRGKQFDTFLKSSFDGNPGLCGGPLSKKCNNSEASPPEEDPHSESVFTFGWKTVVIGYASGTIIGVILGHIFSTRKYEWLAKTFRLQPKADARTRRVRGHRQRILPLRSVLLQFKQSLTVVQCSFYDYPSAYSNVASWNQEEENSDCCLWDGIKCKEDTGHVIRLDLTSSCPYGSINSSSSLFQLVHLECSLCIGIFIILVFLSLTDCILQGEFPAEIFQLPKLVFLALTYDLYLTGYLPEFQNSSVLVDLRISHTRFSGKVPDSLGNLLQLNYLTGEILGRMRIPVEIRKLTQLHILRLAENQLEGSVPSSIFELRNLQALDLPDNNLSGTGDLNFVLLNMESLTALLLSSNKLSLLTGTTVNTNLPNFTIIGFSS